MEKIVNPKVLFGILITILFMSGLSTCQSCSAKKESLKAKKELRLTQIKLDSIKIHTYSKEELDLRMEREGLETSKRTLYDWNSIVRTKVRPDDRMNEYDLEINKIEKQLNSK